MLEIMALLIEIGSLLAKGVSGASTAWNAAEGIYRRIADDPEATVEDIAKALAEIRALYEPLEADFFEDDEPLAT